MKKNHNKKRWLKAIKKFDLKMKITALFVFAILFGTYANNSYSQKASISLDVENATVAKVIDEIETTTQFRFVYNTKYVNLEREVSMKVEEENIEKVLNKLFSNTNTIYKIRDTQIILKDKNEDGILPEPIQDPILVKGKITGLKGESLPGASIIIRGTTKGTTTDTEGNFSLQVLPDATLLISYIGYKSQEIMVNNRTLINIVMEEETAELEQVVVTGYYTANRKTYTGSATTITAAEIAKINSGNLLQALQTIDPAFNILENNEQGSNPNMLPDIELRGAGSLPGLKSEFKYNPNMPTFILDGFEVSAQKIFDLDQNRVLSVTILKDAAATAVYGSRAANGIVVVESKVPEKGKMRVNYKTDMKFSSADLSGYDLLTASEKLDYELLAGIYPGADKVSAIENNMDEYYQKLSLVAMGYNTDWLAQPVNEVSIAHKHSLQIEEGTDKFRYNLNLFYDKNNGVMKKSSRDRLGIGAYFQYRYKNLLFMNNLTYNHVVANNSPYGSFSDYAKVNPYLPFKDIDGNTVKYFDFVNTPNPLYNANIGVIDKEAYDEIINNFKVEWNISDGLKLKTSVAFSKKIIRNQEFLPADHTIFRNYYDSQSGSEKDKAGTYRNEDGENASFNGNFIVSYFKQLKNHYITFNGGFEIVTQTGYLNIFQTRGFPNSLLAYPSFGTSYDMLSSGKPGGSEDISRSMGFFGTINYTWKNKYFADFSGRMDGSSKFGANNRWAKLWSVGIGWNVHYEEFLKNSKAIKMLRFRASTGFTGSQNYNPSQSLTMFDYIRNSYYFWNYPGAELTAMGNEDLKWQRTRKNNIGVDLQLFNKRITASFDYYIEDSKDALTQVTIPPSLGFSSYTENLGQVRNKGYEVKVNFGIISKPKSGIYWSIFCSAAHNKNVLLKISNALTAWNDTQDAINSSNPKVRFIEGQDMKSIWVVPSLGIDPATGQEIFITKDGEYTTVWNAADQVVGGTQTPDLFGNIGTQFAYKQWQLNLYLLYSFGGQTYNQTLVNRVENADPNFNVDRRALEERWKEPGDISRFKNINNLSVTKPTSRFIEDNNYIRLNSVNLSYEFEKRQIEKFKLERLKIIFYANDVFNISSVKQERGLNYPYARSYTLTFQVGF